MIAGAAPEGPEAIYGPPGPMGPPRDVGFGPPGL